MTAEFDAIRPPCGPGDLSAADALRFLTPDLVDFLADLHGAPPAITVAAVQILPFGSRAALLATGLATACDVKGRDVKGRDVKGRDVKSEADAHDRLALTPFAFEVMAEAAARGDREEIRMLADSARSVAAPPPETR